MTEEQERQFKRDTLVTNVMLSVSELSLDCKDPTQSELTDIDLCLSRLQAWRKSQSETTEAV